MYRLLFAFLFSIIIFKPVCNAQISYGGTPYFRESNKNNLKIKKLTRVKSLDKDYQTKYSNSTLKLTKYADELVSEYDILESEISDTINGIVVKRLSIKSEGAYSLSLYFSEFELTEGAKLFIYNDLKVIGSFTSANNKDFGSFATQAIPGDNLTIELSYPLGETPVLVLEKTYHGVKNIFKILKATTSEACNVNINCSEGEEWQIDKKAICRITSKSHLFSGALVNTSNYDCTPYVLTAMHALKDGDDAATCIFYFNYESKNCDGTDVMKVNTISGSELIATTQRLDFSLVKLSELIPKNYDVVYAGINTTSVEPNKTVCIHHPNGDTKKISINNDSSPTATYKDIGIPYVLENSHWLVKNWEVGTTEGGSSGSPLFDEDHLIVGTLSGGGAPCSSNINDFFSKIDMAWNHFLGINNQLEHWLNLSGKNTKAIGLYAPYEPIGIKPIALPKEVGLVGESVCIFANIYGSIEGLTYEWDFGSDASPSKAKGVGPFNVTYSDTGSKSVSVKIYKDGTLLHEVTENNIVFVSEFIRIKSDKTVSCTDDKIMFSLELLNGYDDFTYKWDFGKGAIPKTSDKLADISVVYESGGYKTITLEAYKGGELVERIERHSYIEILDTPKAKFDIEIKDMTVSFNNRSVYANSYIWDFGDSEISTEESPVHQYKKDRKYKVTLISSRKQCVSKDTLITDIRLDYNANFYLYPNPTRDRVKLNFRNLKTGKIDYWLYSVDGKLIANGKFDVSDNLVEYDVSNLSAGIYYMRIAIDNRHLTKKLVVIN